jgi:hypothetical protein
VILEPHFGHVLSGDVITFSRLVFVTGHKERIASLSLFCQPLFPSIVDGPIDRCKQHNSQHDEQYVFESPLIHSSQCTPVTVVPASRDLERGTLPVRQRADRSIAEDLSYRHYGEARAKLGQPCEEH